MKLNDFSQIIQIATNIFLIAGGIVAIVQYKLSVNDAKESLKNEVYHADRQKMLTAAELAKYYIEQILPSMRELKKIFIDIGVYDITKSIDKNNMIDFDIVELEKNLSDSQIEQIKVSGADYHLSTLVQEQGIAYNISYTTEENTNGNAEHPNNNSSVVNNKISAEDFGRKVMTTLNSLEYFSMYFTHNIADHTVVYQPLHMTFLEAVRMLYYNISSINTKGEQKFYINTIALFKQWTEISIKQEEKEHNAMRNAANMGKILKDYEKLGLYEDEENVDIDS